jgi:hypothetical protein
MGRLLSWKMTSGQLTASGFGSIFPVAGLIHSDGISPSRMIPCACDSTAAWRALAASNGRVSQTVKMSLPAQACRHADASACCCGPSSWSFHW